MATSSPQAYFAAIAFYERAFGAGQVGDRFTGPGGELIHAEIRIGDSVVMITDDAPSHALAGSVTRFHPVRMRRDLVCRATLLRRPLIMR